MPPRRIVRRRAGEPTWFGKSRWPQPLPYDRHAARPGPNQVTAKQQRAWLNSSADWPDLQYPQWRAKRILGVGAYGICGLWQRFLRAGPQPREVVVKQAHPNNADELKIESILLKRIRDSTDFSGGTDHIVKLYKEQYRDPGGQSGSKIFDHSPWDLQGNPDPNLDVARIYLEYCKGGDLWHQCQKLPDTPWSEEECWRLLECLANGAVVMDSGTENPILAANIWAQYAPAGAHWASRQIAHFDLKPPNILIGEADPNPNGQHHRLHPFKIGDFGLALPIPPAPQVHLDGWVTETQWRSTPGWAVPEQTTVHSERRQGAGIGPKSNVFGIGLIMHNIMVWQGKRKGMDGLLSCTYNAVRDTFTYTFDDFQATTPTIMQMPNLFTTLGHDLFQTPYSSHLIELVQACLAWEPNQRLSAQDVRTYVDTVLLTFGVLNGANNGTTHLGKNPNNLAASPSYSDQQIAAMGATTQRQCRIRGASYGIGAVPVTVPAVPQPAAAPLPFPMRPRRAIGPRP